MTRAVRFAEFGGPEVLQVVDTPTREPGDGEVRVRLAAAGLNPADYKRFRGRYPGRPELPAGVGRELAGVVVATGPATGRLAAGDSVFGTVPDGALVEDLVVEEARLAFVPRALSWEIAGGLALAGQTAWDALASQALRPGDTIVVTAAAGGVGGMLSQLAVHAGLRVIGSASERNHDWLRSRGIEPVPYGTEFPAAVRALVGDRIPAAGFDLHGAEEVRQLLDLGIPPARVNTNAVVDPPAGVQRVGRGPTALDTLGSLAALVVAGRLEVPIAATYPFDEAAEAYAFLEAGHLRGKVVLRGAADAELAELAGTSEP